jgi:hypothetical protein
LRVGVRWNDVDRGEMCGLMWSVLATPAVGYLRFLALSLSPIDGCPILRVLGEGSG